jgi:hypothetical protein
MKVSTTQLERVLDVSVTLKRILKLQFESTKLASNYDITDFRDLTRAAQSVAIIQDLLQTFDQDSKDQQQKHRTSTSIAVVEQLRGPAMQIANEVRMAAARAMQEQHSYSQLGAVLTVYYHLGELDAAVYKALDRAYDMAMNTTKSIFLAASSSSSSNSNIPMQWAEGIAEAAMPIRNLELVLARKTDPVRNRRFLDVVAQQSIPTKYAKFNADPTTTTTRNNNNNNHHAQQQQQQQQHASFSIFRLFWTRLCISLAEEMRKRDASMYPSLRAAAIPMVALLLESGASAMDDPLRASAGILGGTSGGIMATGMTLANDENPQSPSADTWTQPSSLSTTTTTTASTSSSLSRKMATNATAVQASLEWKILEGNAASPTGLYNLQQAFLESVTERLMAPLQYMFPTNDAMIMDGDGSGMMAGSGGGSSMLPSKYDIQRFDENIRQELALADPRQLGAGSGDLTLVTLIAECVVRMISDFCVRAKNAMTAPTHTEYLKDDWSMSEGLLHDRKVVAILFTLKNYLSNAAEKTFIAPYRPAFTPQHAEAANLCKTALAPALIDIDTTVKSVVLIPLCRALNQRISLFLAKMHSGVYLSSNNNNKNNAEAASDENAPSFIQKELADIFEMIAKQHLARFPTPYASIIASNVASFTIYTFVSNASLLRPIGETARLCITQDLTDLEMALEQLLSKTGSLTLSHVENGKPYLELRAMRQMLFWSGLENRNKPAEDVAKSLLREIWLRDVRPSTVFHYLISFAPSLLSSPYHAKRMSAAEYVKTLVRLDGTWDEDASWMTVLSCCDSYQQRASSSASGGGLYNNNNDANEGDPRIAQIVMTLGQELIRRRGRN